MQSTIIWPKPGRTPTVVMDENVRHVMVFGD